MERHKRRKEAVKKATDIVANNVAGLRIYVMGNPNFMVEGSNVEFKRELNDKLEKEVVSFLNANGGHLYIGVGDDGTPCGVEDIDATQLAVKDRIKNNVSPSAIYLFEAIPENRDGLDVLHLVIASGNQKPYYIRKFGMCPEGAYVRVANSCLSLNEKQIFDLYSKRARTSLTNIPSPRQDLTFRQLRIYYDSAGFEFLENTYKQLSFLLEGEGFNYLAYLLSDQNALVFNVGLFLGEDVGEVKEIRSLSNQSLVKTAHDVLDYVEGRNRVFAKITSGARKEERLFDPVAMREALVNAIVHNDYSYENPPTFRVFSDRVEIISSGGLPRGIEEREFLGGYMSPKNPALMRVFKDLGFVEHMGTGILRILKSYDPSIFSFSSNFIKVTIPFRKVKGILPGRGKKEETREEAILDMVKANPRVRQSEIASSLGVSRYTVIREMKSLEEAGLIEKVGSKKTGGWILSD